MRETLVKTEEFKDSPLGKIPKEWEVCSIEEKLERIIDYRGKTPEKTTSGVPLITAKNVREGYLDPEPREYIHENDYSHWMTRGFPNPGDVLFTTEAPLGNVARVPSYKLALAQRLLTLCANPNELDAGYLFWVLNWLDSRQRLEQKSTGSTVLGIKQSVFRKILFRFPPLPEQRYIAEILDTVDEAIAHTSSLIAKLKQMKAGLLHDLLTRGLDENGELRDVIAHPEQFKDSPLGRIPKDWEILPLTSLTQYITYGFTNPMPTTKDGPWMITAFDIADGKICYEQARHTSEKAYKNDLTQKSKPDLGDILITKDGTLGRIAVVDRIDICINQSVACLRPLPDTDVKFLVHYLRSEQGQERMLADAEGSTIKHIYITKLAQMEVPIPPREEARKISDILDSHNTRIGTEEAYREKLKLQKQGLMHDLLTGKVRVKNA
jgi:type I restriction enzyme S subunit